LGSSPTNAEMQATLLLSSNVKSGKLPESTSVEYSCGGGNKKIIKEIK